MLDVSHTAGAREGEHVEAPGDGAADELGLASDGALLHGATARTGLLRLDAGHTVTCGSGLARIDAVVTHAFALGAGWHEPC
jgi:hypothetical protein